MKRTIFFNWDKVLRSVNHDPYKTLDLFKQFSKTGVPTKLAGNSFILNVYDLMNIGSYDSDRFDYIILAAHRNYFDYEYQEDTSLWLPYSPIDTVKISKNRLLQINDNHIQFKYEKDLQNGTYIFKH